MTAWLVLAGVVTGLGVAVVVGELAPTRPDLGAALDRLRAQPTTVVEDQDDDRRTAVGMWLRRLAERCGIPVPLRDLRLIGHTPDAFVVAKTAGAVAGLAAPTLTATVLAADGVEIPLAVPVLGTVGLAVTGFLGPDAWVRRRATVARTEFRQVLCSYLDLVALERLADAGATQALDRATTVGDGWVFTRLRDTLAHAHLAHHSPWHALASLAADVGVTELADLGDIVAVAGEDGAAVHRSLRARARALRTALLTEHAAAANAATERLAIPVACLGLLFVALLVYPAIARILTT